ncbi:C-type lectin domain family 12 member A-like [Dipodomys spectabilis]|uniref:C-type lectin domain family 12 member A-like n=1 Tax=Dipodomys spectabilis TaxID=105255 RepID=UPI001C54BCD4|nr:C-type lectin domain family 12 member A-like [Dipodomys spectabilis]
MSEEATYAVVNFPKTQEPDRGETKVVPGGVAIRTVHITEGLVHDPEEITYADLNNQSWGKTETIREFDQAETRGLPIISQIWVRTALGLTLLLLLLLFIGLGILGSVIHKQQNVQEELQRNVSLQQMGIVNSFEKIQNLSITVQTLATRLCQELQEKEPEHTCNPCAQNWIWHADACYLLHRISDTWQNSVKSCADRNASLLKINRKDALDFVKPLELYNYWLGASPRQHSTYYPVKVDDNIMSNIWLESSLADINKMYCGYLHQTYIYYTSCIAKLYAMCEKKTAQVKEESVLGESPR